MLFRDPDGNIVNSSPSPGRTAPSARRPELSTRSGVGRAVDARPPLLARRIGAVPVHPRRADGTSPGPVSCVNGATSGGGRHRGPRVRRGEGLGDRGRTYRGRDGSRPRADDPRRRLGHRPRPGPQVRRGGQRADRGRAPQWPGCPAASD